MARWRLYLGRKLIEEYSIEKSPIRIGRQADADIVLDHQSVSRKHAVLERTGNNWTVQIEDGKNGLFVNGQFTTNRQLNNGDRIEIGRHVIHFIETPRSISMEENTPIGDETLLDDAATQGDPGENTVTSTGYSDSRSLDQKTVTMSLDELKRMHQRNQNVMGAHISWFDNKEKKLATLQAMETFLGKGEDCLIQLSGGLPGVKRFAAIFKKGETYYLEPLSRFVPVKIEGELIKEPVRLYDGDKIQIFSQILQFHEPM